MITPREKIYNLSQYIDESTRRTDIRAGQMLFSSLRPEIANRIRGTAIDPFHKEFTYDQVYSWLEEHIIFNDEGEMIGLFSGNLMLWEKE